MANISVNDLAKEITNCLKDYTDDVIEALEKTQEDLAKEAVAELKSKSPKSEGKYAKGWRKKKTRKKQIIHNKTHWWKTHLLENGHAKRGGGRVAAQPHIKPVEKSIFEKADSALKKRLR